MSKILNASVHKNDKDCNSILLYINFPSLLRLTILN